jgi:hypothetical protein
MRLPNALLNRPRSSFEHSRVRAALHAAIILGAVAMPVLAFGVPRAEAQSAPVQAAPAAASNTLKEVTTRGNILVIPGFGDIDVVYTPDGKFTAMAGEVKGTWRIDGETLCTTTNVQPVESCALYPKDKKSGDRFEIMTEAGLVEIRIK